MYGEVTLSNDFSQDYLLDKQIKILQPLDGYRASTDAVLLSAMVDSSEKDLRILDVGSGTGVISLCLAQRLKKLNPQIFGIEIQPCLCELSNKSAELNNFDFVSYINADITQKKLPEQLLPCTFDIVITNPPYSDHDMPSPNQSKATAHNHHGLNLSEWLKFCLKMLKPFGNLYIINRTEALPEICNALYGKAGGLTVLPLYSKQSQTAKRIIVKAQKDSKSPCRICEPFIVHNPDGSYTENAEKILRQGLEISKILTI